jgi:hypothetical protein
MNALPWRLAPTLRLFPQPSVRYGPFSEATPGSTSGTSRKTRSTKLSRRSSTPITTSPCRGSGDRANTPQPMEPAGISMNRTFSPNTTSAMADMGASAIITSPTPTSPSSATSFRAASGRRSTSSTVYSRTKATSSPTFFMPTPKGNRSPSSRSLICSASS